ncbi:MAG: IclR family transcriptional regulator C-terminal domain-containing protein [Faecalimonas umbilicata]
MVGKSIPLYCSGVGKALLADMKDEKVKEIWDHSEIRKLTDYTVVDFVKFQNLIADVRKNSYAMDNEENELGVRCIAVSLKSSTENPRMPSAYLHRKTGWMTHGWNSLPI